MAEQGGLDLDDPTGGEPRVVPGAWARRVTERVLRTHRHVLAPNDPVLMVVTAMEVLLEEHAQRLTRDAARQREEGLAAIRLEVAAARSLLEDLVNEAGPHLVDQVRRAVPVPGDAPPQQLPATPPNDVPLRLALLVAALLAVLLGLALVR